MQQISTFFFNYLIFSVLFKYLDGNPARVDLREHDLSHISSEQLRRVVTQDEGRELRSETDEETLLEHLYNQTQYRDQNRSKCTSCTIREDQKRNRIESIKNRISHALRLDVLGKPNMTNNKLPKIPQFQKLKQKYEIREALDMQSDEVRNSQEDYVEEFGQSQRTYTFAQLPPTELNIEQPNSIYFTLPDLVDKVLEKAFLWVYIDPSQNVTQIYIYSLVKSSKNNDFIEKQFLSRKKRSSRGWQHFNILNEVEKWIEDPSRNKGLVVEALDDNGRNSIILPSANDDGYEPVLDTRTSLHQQHSRRKRSIYLNCDEEHATESCCRYPLTVDFVEFGWDFIIAPLTYSAYYCAGECRNQHMDSGPHGYLRQQVDAIPPEHGPCCSPTRMGQLSMLYFDHSMNIQFTTLPRMKVERCGCT